MKLNYKFGILLIFTLFINAETNAQAPAIQWQKSLGGTGIDNASAVIKTSDGGYVIAGNSQSNDGNVTGNHGSDDFWIVKLNSTGNIQWQKSLGGTNIEYANSITQTNDGGFIVAGSSQSNNGDVSGNHGSGDIWIIKLNSDAGVIEWQKSLGGSSFDWATSIKQTTDGGYIIGGCTQSNNGNVTGNYGFIDYWIVKINSDGGVIEWQKNLGGTGDDRATSIIQTTDGGYMVAGFSESLNGDVTGNHGNKDYWIIKLSSTGAIEWKKCLGGINFDLAYSIIQTIDGGYMVAGFSSSNDGDVTGNHVSGDYWIAKLSSTGAIQWQKSLGGTSADTAYSIIQTTDGGYIITGTSNSNDGDVTGHHGIEIPEVPTNDSWVVKLNSIGAIQWQKSLGGTTDDYASSIIQTTDGGYIIAGSSNSNDGDVTGNHGNYDYWIVKLAPDNLANNSFKENTKITLFPNPAKNNITLKLDYVAPSQEITITDILGKIISTQKVEGFITSINTSNLQKGIYFLNLVDGILKTTRKFIID